ncbi:hypothetical protein AAE478_009792 [Parahypoxylon ruwenzoriense]
MPNSTNQNQGQGERPFVYVKPPLKSQSYALPDGKARSTYTGAAVPNPTGAVGRPFVWTGGSATGNSGGSQRR